MLTRWRQWRRRQRDALRASYHRPDAEPAPSPAPDLLRDTLRAAAQDPAQYPPAQDPPAEGPPAQDEPAQDPERHAGTHDSASARFGRAGRPLNRQSPFYIGFVGALGVLIAVGLYEVLGRLTPVFTLLVVAMFLTLALDPLVQSLTRRGFSRALSVTAVFSGVLAVIGLLASIVIPPVAEQGALLTESAPRYLEQVLQSPPLRELDRDFDVTERIQEEFQRRVTDGGFMSNIFGGVLGAGRAVLSGFFSTFTVLILTLYFLATLPRVKLAAYAMVPASRRTRVQSLSEEIMRRVGSYAIGQVVVATTNAVCSWVMMSVVGIRYAAVLAVAVGFLGLIPMVGATLGAALVALVALFDEPQKAAIAVVYYVAYQQLENYVIAPRIMQRTVAVPGAVTVVAALAGGALLGILGALLAIPVAAGLLLLYEEVLLPRQQRV